MKVFLLLAVVAAVVVFLLWRSRRREESVNVRNIVSRPQPPADQQLIRFRAGPNACSPARQQAGKRVSSDERPRLPLPGCRAHRCQCRFEAISGQRQEPRRQESERRESIRFDDKGGDRRKKDRRKDSGDPWGIDRE